MHCAGEVFAFNDNMQRYLEMLVVEFPNRIRRLRKGARIPCELAIVELFELRSQIDHFTHDNECGPIRKRGLGVGELGKGEKWLVARRRARAKGQIQNLRFKISEELLLGGACSAVHACARIPSEVSC